MAGLIKGLSQKDYMAKWYLDNKATKLAKARKKMADRTKWAADYGGGKCKWPRCDVTDPFILAHHHRNPKTKLFEISYALTRPLRYSDRKIKAEIRKCDLYCLNHHAYADQQLDNERIATYADAKTSTDDEAEQFGS